MTTNETNETGEVGANDKASIDGWLESFRNVCEDASAALKRMSAPSKLVIAVLRKTVREASIVCAALERMGHEAHPFGWSDPEKNRSLDGLMFDLVDVDEANVMRFESNELPSAVVAACLAMRSETDEHKTINRWRVTNARGAEHAVRDDVETILAHIGDLQRDAHRWQESQRAKVSPEPSDPAVVLGVEGAAGSFVVDAAEPQAPPSIVGCSVILRGGGGFNGIHTIASEPATMQVGGVWCDAVIVASDTSNGIVTSIVPVAALEVVTPSNAEERP